MRNLIRGMLIVATLSVGMGTSLTSCKDNYDELRDEMRKDNVDLNKKIADLQGQLDALKKLQETCQANCEAARKALQAQIDLLKGDLANKADKSWVEGEITRLEGMIPDISGLQASVTELEKAIAGINTTLAGKADQTYVDSLINAVNVNLTNLKTELGQQMDDLKTNLEAQISALSTEIGKKVDQTTYDAFVAAQEAVNRQVEDNKTAIAQINETLSAMQLSIQAVEQKADKAYAQAMSNLAHLNALIEKVHEIENQKIPALEGRLTQLESEAVSLRNDLEALTDRVKKNEGDISTLNTELGQLNAKVDELLNRAKVQITSMSIDQVYNYVYGTVDTPFGVKSNFLLSFWGWADQPVNFPGNGHEFDGKEVLTDADRAILGTDRKEYEGLMIKGSEDNNYAGNAGRIFFRVNPSRVDLTNTQFSLVNTRGDVSAAKVETPKPFDEVLYFGYTHARSLNENGMYYTDVTLNSTDAVNSVKVEIEPGLKSAVKDVIKEKSLSSLATLSKLIYDQVSQVLPKLALRADWKVGETINSTHSPSDLGITAVRPLSFGFYYGQSVPGRRMPILDPLSELLNADDFKFDLDLDDIELDDIEFEISAPVINMNDVGDITITADVVDDHGNVIGHLDNVVVDSDALVEGIKNAIESAIGSMTDDIEEQVTAAINNIQGQIETQINQMLENISGQINGQITDYINKINNKTAPFIDRYNQFLPKYNSLAKRINKFLDNPNAYLQTLMVYQSSTEGGFHVLSNNINRPSRFVLDGGDAIYLYPTTRTAETVAPAFKKFVGVTNAWNTGDPSVNAQDNGGVWKQVVDQINAAGNMNTIIDGEDMHVTFYIPGTAKGKTFEIVYQALDYHGITSTQKYYVTVE